MPRNIPGIPGFHTKKKQILAISLFKVDKDWDIGW
jgi:hypothetical protein